MLLWPRHACVGQHGNRVMNERQKPTVDFCSTCVSRAALLSSEDESWAVASVVHGSIGDCLQAVSQAASTATTRVWALKNSTAPVVVLSTCRLAAGTNSEWIPLYAFSAALRCWLASICGNQGSRTCRMGWHVHGNGL